MSLLKKIVLGVALVTSVTGSFVVAPSVAHAVVFTLGPAYPTFEQCTAAMIQQGLAGRYHVVFIQGKGYYMSPNN